MDNMLHLGRYLFRFHATDGSTIEGTFWAHERWQVETALRRRAALLKIPCKDLTVMEG